MLLACATAERSADSWLGLLDQGQDERALARMQLDFGTPGEFSERFGERVDRLDLRGHSASWDQVVEPGLVSTGRVQGRLDDGREISMRVDRGGVVSGVQLGQTTLIPSDRYHVIPAPPPLDEPLSLDGLRVAQDRGALHVDAAVPFGFEGASFTVDHRCQIEGLWMRGAITSTHTVPAPGTHPVALWAPLDGEASQCQVLVEMSQQDGRRQSRFCWRPGQVQDGPCEAQPVPEDVAGVWVEDVVVELGPERGGTVDYVLAVGEALPEPYGSLHASIGTELACANRTVRHSRPINSTWVEPGERRSLGSPFTEQVEGPCDVSLTLTVWDHYTLERTELWSGTAP
jgi:hypothetical protein